MLVKISASDGVPKLFCPICNKALVSLQGYVKHVKKHEPPGGFMCRFCDARFCSEDELKKHRETEHTTIACRLCKDTTFTNETNYRAHIRDVHQGVDRELYKCEKCGAAYKTLEPYRRHIETDCGAIKPFKCDKCPMAFMTKYNLKAHLDNHSGELKFCCSYCGRNFKQKARLVEHERTHTGEKPYKCDVCGKSFSHRESIVTHSSLHTGIRLVECKCCSSRFSCYSNLIKHRRNRPDTCGRPEYDPPKNRIRKHTSRIPAVLNPNSEIKVVNVNKIIKPEDLEKVQAMKKESPDKAKEKDTARKRTGGAVTKRAEKRGPKKKMPPKKAIIEFEESDNEDLLWAGAKDEEDDGDDDDEKPLKELIKTERTKRKCNMKPLNQTSKDNDAADTALQEPLLNPLMSTETSINKTTTTWSDDSEDDYVPDFEPEEEDSDDYDISENRSIQLPVQIKQENKDDTTHIQIEAVNDLEFTSLPIDTNMVKSENEDSNIFNEKDKILACLLNESDYSRLDKEGESTLKNDRLYSATTTKPLENEDDEEEEFILEETEVVLVKNEDNNEDEYPLEDILDVKSEFTENLNNTVDDKCYVLLEDITNRYPELKTQSTIKVARNCQPFFSKSIDVKKRLRKSKAQTDKDDSSCTQKSKRKSRVTAEQLKERMRLLKKRDKTYQCPDCIKLYYMRKPFEKHLRDDHHKNDEEIKELLKDEIEELPTEDVYKCHICDKIYLMEKRLKDHIPKHGPDGNLIHKCPCYCVLYFATREEAQAHAHEVHKDLLWCEICEKFMTGSDALKSHKMRIHGTKEVQFKRNLICDKCGKKFMGRTQLMDHVRSDCGRVPIYQCQVCGKCLTTAGILKTHMLLHKDDRPYQCDQCGKSFKIKAQYKTHIKYGHSEEKRFKCHLCPKAYPYRESLLTHMAVHTGIKRFLCNGCGKRFTCVSNLQAHRKVHAETCGLLPLNAKATQYMGVQKGTLLLGAKPEPGLDYVESQTLVAKEVFTQDVQATTEDVVRSMQPSNSLSAGLPLNYSADIILM
ncbi:zinc finger and BTB domain-containing protein 41 [Musca vetustissima]|uniref:zinc finger and BTB domain-containing protein 41 n=1 Tax=Musca vetustissima TaxID=27455 RepID=UPI002AB7650A|nr:zinc finger and BTB domain-containing protein 41 [Musca vetustissima]